MLTNYEITYTNINGTKQTESTTDRDHARRRLEFLKTYPLVEPGSVRHTAKKAE